MFKYFREYASLLSHDFRNDNNNNNNACERNVKASLFKNQRLESAYAICPAFGLDFALSIQAR